MLTEGRYETREYSIIPVQVTITDLPLFLSLLRKTGSDNGVTLVCVNQNMIAGHAHLKTALSHAIRSWKEDRMIARSLEMEVLLYAAGTRQTNRISLFSPAVGENMCYLCIIPPDIRVLDVLPAGIKEVPGTDWDIISPEKKERLMDFFDITPEEIGAVGEEKVTDLVRERSALLTVNR